MSVCLFVCLLTTFCNLDKYRHIIYGWKRTSKADVLNYKLTWSN